MTAYLLICTARYKELFDYFYKSFRKHYPQDDLIVLTDDVDYFRDYDCKALLIKHLCWPGMVMNKYRNILRYKELLKGYDYIVCLQVNMHFEKPLPTMDAPLTYCYHPYNGDNQDYVCGGLVGGRTPDFMLMAAVVQRWLDNHPNAQWHDETALNWYWHNHKDRCSILPSSTMYAEERSELRQDDAAIMLRCKSSLLGSDNKESWTTLQ